MPYSLEYIWLDRQGFTRSKVRTVWDTFLTGNPLPQAHHLPVWNFDASSTGQNIGADTEAVLKPIDVYPDPLTRTKHPHFLVLCELDLEYDRVSDQLLNATLESGFSDDFPKPLIGFNTRYWASCVAQRHVRQEPWFGLEQEYTFLDPKTDLPYRWEEFGRVGQGAYYCSVRYPYCQLNQLVRDHYAVCLEAGLKINGFNAEVLPSQWEFQIGPSDLLTVADDLIMARYFLFRMASELGVKVSFHPKPMQGNWNGSGCHINFSTLAMRTKKNDETSDPQSLEAIKQAVSRLEADHPKILQYYGEQNVKMRLTGQHETSSASDFSWGIGTRHTSVRIPNNVAAAGEGYLEDRRPASNIDPYLALGKLLTVCCSEETK